MAALRMAGSLGRPSGFFRTLAFRYLVESPDCATPALTRTHFRSWSSKGIRVSIDIRSGLCSDVRVSRAIGRNAMSRHLASSNPACGGIGSSDWGSMRGSFWALTGQATCGSPISSACYGSPRFSRSPGGNLDRGDECGPRLLAANQASNLRTLAAAMFKVHQAWSRTFVGPKAKTSQSLGVSEWAILSASRR